MRVNFGCGKRVLDGFVNIDAQVGSGSRNPDLVFALEFDKIGKVVREVPLHSECATLVQAMHVVEHFYHWEVRSVLSEFRRLLKPGGSLVLELPNIEAAARNLLAGMDDQMAMWPLYGNPDERDPYMCHRWGYTPKTIKALLAECGFIKIELKPPQTHGARANRDMRLEARKP